MRFLIIARDGTDSEALGRRLKHRAAHLENASKLQQSGHLLLGGALLDDAGRMTGSAMVAEFPSGAELDACLKADPYLTGGVWQTIEVLPYQISPFYHLVCRATAAE